MTAQTTTHRAKKRRLIGAEISAEQWSRWELYCLVRDRDPLELINTYVQQMIDSCTEEYQDRLPDKYPIPLER